MLWFLAQEQMFADTVADTDLSQEKIHNQHSSYIQNLLNKRQNIPKIWYAYLHESYFYYKKISYWELI